MPAGRHPPVYPVFGYQKSNRSDEKLVKQKIALKKTTRTNTIASNFVWEQLTIKPKTKSWKSFQLFWVVANQISGVFVLYKLKIDNSNAPIERNEKIYSKQTRQIAEK